MPFVQFKVFAIKSYSAVLTPVKLNVNKSPFLEVFAWSIVLKNSFTKVYAFEVAALSEYR
ncbi:MAG: hypothetical protein QXO01_02465 [Nitrososphaerota archaeon]